jgi:pimeloyl-ACP methyl ester carboxylesterase
LTVYDCLVEAARRDADFAEATRLVRSASVPRVFSDWWDEVDDRLWTFAKRKQDHDPIPDALRLRCPHLAIYGGADELVPIAESIHLFSTAACHPDRDDRATLTVEVFPHANHRIQISGGTHLAPGYLDTLTRWIHGRTEQLTTPHRHERALRGLTQPFRTPRSEIGTRCR